MEQLPPSVAYSRLAPEQVSILARAIRVALRRGGAGSKNSSDTGCVGTTTDIAELEPDAVRRVLQDLPIEDKTVLVLWPADRAGARMGYTDFVRFYDDLWYPSRDDVWVTNDGTTWLLELDHEEVMRFRSLSGIY